MKQPIEIQAVGPEAAETISQIINQAFAEYAEWLDPPSGAHHETPEQVALKLCAGQGLLAQIGAAPVGCLIYELRGDHAYFGRLAVLPRQRGQGVARVLVAAVEQRAAALGFGSVQLGVRAALPQLRAWYERLGYRVIEERRHAGYQQTTYVMMEKDVTRWPDEADSR